MLLLRNFKSFQHWEEVVFVSLENRANVLVPNGTTDKVQCLQVLMSTAIMRENVRNAKATARKAESDKVCFVMQQVGNPQSGVIILKTNDVEFLDGRVGVQ